MSILMVFVFGVLTLSASTFSVLDAKSVRSILIAGSLAPPEARLHGTENLLHRACTEGNIVVVTELLSMGYR